jgi:kynurenine formamidase
VAGLVVTLAGSPAVADTPPAVAPGAARRLAAALRGDAVRLVDLTHRLDERTIYWPAPPQRFELVHMFRGRTPAGFFYAANRFCTAEHGGTHLDAPSHFAEQGRAADQIPVRQLLAEAVVIDMREQPGRDPDYRLQPAEIVAFEKRHGRIPAGAAVLLHTGWSQRWPDRKRYLGDDRPARVTDLHFPSYGAEAARLLVEDRHVGLLGVDTASIDHGPSRSFEVHQVTARANVPGLENLKDLDQLPVRGAWLMALPAKIGAGTGGPLRAVALVPR